MNLLAKRISSLVFCLIFTGSMFAFQDGSGRSTAPGQNPMTPSPQIKKKRVKVKAKPVRSSGSGAVSQGNADVTISVSEPEAEVFLTDRSGKSIFEEDSRVTDAGKTPIVLDSIRSGVYTLVVRKPGYSEHRQSLTVTAGKPNNVNVGLIATTAFLTVSGKLAGAEITIDGHGTFQGELRRFQLPPGTYRITIKKKGFATAEYTTTLSFLGQESVIIPSLRPLSSR